MLKLSGEFDHLRAFTITTGAPPPAPPSPPPEPPRPRMVRALTPDEMAARAALAIAAPPPEPQPVVTVSCSSAAAAAALRRPAVAAGPGVSVQRGHHHRRQGRSFEGPCDGHSEAPIPAASPAATPASPKRPGRPHGSGPYQAVDRPIIAEVVEGIQRGTFPNMASALKAMLPRIDGPNTTDDNKKLRIRREANAVFVALEIVAGLEKGTFRNREEAIELMFHRVFGSGDKARRRRLLRAVVNVETQGY